MKKFIILCSIVIAIVATVWFKYNDYKINSNKLLSQNFEYEELYQKEIFGTDLTINI